MNSNDKFNLEIANLNYKPKGITFLSEHIWQRLNPVLSPMHVLVVGYLADLEGHPLLKTGYGAFVADEQYSESMNLTFGDIRILEAEFYQAEKIDIEPNGSQKVSLAELLALYDEFAFSHKNVMYANDQSELTAQTLTYPLRHLYRTVATAAQYAS